MSGQQCAAHSACILYTHRMPVEKIRLDRYNNNETVVSINNGAGGQPAERWIEISIMGHVIMINSASIVQ